MENLDKGIEGVYKRTDLFKKIINKSFEAPSVELALIHGMHGIYDQAFAAGRLQGISEAEGVVPEERVLPFNDTHNIIQAMKYNEECGFNNCRQQTLDNIQTKLKEGK